MNMNLKKLLAFGLIALTLTGCGGNKKESVGGQDVEIAEVAGSAAYFRTNVNCVIYFEYDSDAVTPEAKIRLDEQIEFMKKYPETKYTIEGNCDVRGTVEYNLALGERRANAVCKYIVDQGISSDRILVKSNGKSCASDGGSEEMYAKDRNATTICTVDSPETN